MTNDQEWQEILSKIESRETTQKCMLATAECELNIRHLERESGFTFPERYRDWLNRFDDVSFDGAYFFGLSGDGSLANNQYEWISESCVNIASDGCGDHFAIALDGRYSLDAPIIFIDAYKELSDAYIVGSDFTKFIQGLLLEEQGICNWPFDRNITLAIDPEILHAQRIHFPWDDENQV